MGFVKEFREFATKGNVIDLAVGIIIGGAFGKIVTSLVSDVMMPLVNPMIPGGDWRALVVGPDLKVGTFIGTVIDFVITALAIFIMIKAINRVNRKKKPEAPASPPAPSKEEILLTEIRDLLKSKA